MTLMNIPYNSFLFEGYWWLSLLGGLHCIGLGIYLRYLYRDRNDNHKILGAIFSLIALYFFTGLISRENSPIPLQLLFMLIIPAYFLLMPLLYLYCYRSLHNVRQDIRMSWHFLPAFILILVVSLVFVFNQDTQALQYDDTRRLYDHVTLLGTLLPILLSLQTAGYFYAIINLLRRFKGRAHRAHQDSLKDIKFRWLLSLTLAMLINWLIRMGLVILPFLLGDKVTLAAQASTRLLLLLTVYMLAIYGLKQITSSAYLRGRLAPLPPASTSTDAKPLASSHQLLDAEELNYLQQLLQADKKP